MAIDLQGRYVAVHAGEFVRPGVRAAHGGADVADVIPGQARGAAGGVFRALRDRVRGLSDRYPVLGLVDRSNDGSLAESAFGIDHEDAGPDPRPGGAGWPGHR